MFRKSSNALSVITFTLFALVFAFLIPPIASADVVPENFHPVDRCVRMVNLNAFPDIVLVGYDKDVNGKDYEAYQIKNNICLIKGYKFNTLNIYWTTKEKFNSIDLKNLRLNNLTLLLDNIEPDAAPVSNSNPLIKENVEYSIAGFSNGKLVLYKSRQISEYNNGASKKVETFKKPQVDQELENPNPQPNIIISTPSSKQPLIISTPSPEPVKRGFWQSIRCLFIRLLGGSCQ